MDKIDSLSINNSNYNTPPSVTTESNHNNNHNDSFKNIKQESILQSKPDVWKPLSKNGPVTPIENICRNIKGNLNKLTIEKFETLTEKIAIQCENIDNYNDILLIVDLIINKAVSEPDWSEMYSDLCQILFWRSREYIVDGKRLSFASALLTKIQCEYESTPRDFEDRLCDDEYELYVKKLKTRVLGVVKMIGELFQRRMLGFKIVNKVVYDLVMNKEEPHEYFIECFIQLIYSTGYYIDCNDSYRPVLDLWFGRLKELLLKKCYSKRIKCIIQDVINLPKAQWHKKIHKETAKALNDLREQIQSEDILGGSALAAQFGHILIVGQRYNLNANCTYGDYMKKQEHLYKDKKHNSNNNHKH